MKTTRFLTTLLALCLMLSSFGACTSSNDPLQDEEEKQAPQTETETEKEAEAEGETETEVDNQAYEYEQAQKAYAELNKAAELCVQAMDAIYGAWYFSIYEAKFGTSDYKNYDGFEARTGIEYKEIEAAMSSIGLSYDQSYYLTEASYAVKIAQICLINRYTYSDAHAYIDNAKAYIKELTNEYADYTAYPTLKLYYSEISSYLEFIESPSGSFSQLQTTIDTYETNIRTYKNDLSFTLE